MKISRKRNWCLGIVFISAFLIWTMLIQKVDVQPLGVKGTMIGFATINGWFHKITGVHMAIYHITDWLGLVPILACMFMGCIGLRQWIQRRSIRKIDFDILCLGIYYVVVIAAYLAFEMLPINYRPILIDGRMEVSYPSSTTLLVLCVMPTIIEQVQRRVKNKNVKKWMQSITYAFSLFMVLGRLVCGVHWITDIIGAIFFSCGWFHIYKGIILWYDKTKN